MAQQQQRQGNSPASAHAAQTQGCFHPASGNGARSRHPPTRLRPHAVKLHLPDFVLHVVLHFALHFVLPVGREKSMFLWPNCRPKLP